MKEPLELPYDRCRELLSSAEVGRVALCTDSGPLIWPVNYSVVEDAVVFRTAPYSVLGARPTSLGWRRRKTAVRAAALGWAHRSPAELTSASPLPCGPGNEPATSFLAAGAQRT